MEYARRLKSMGAVNVLVSRAGKGAVLVDEWDRVHVCGACSGTVRNSVGAGDSMVAGFLAGCGCVPADLETGAGSGDGQSGGGAMAAGSTNVSAACDYGYALMLGTAAGGATAFSDGLARREDIFRLLGQLFT